MMKEVIYLAAEWYDSVGHTDGLKGLNEIIDLKMIFLLYIQPHAVPNLHNFISSVHTVFIDFYFFNVLAHNRKSNKSNETLLSN